MQKRFSARFLRFATVGLAGFVVQLVMIVTLTPLLAPHYLAVTAIAVESAVLHNFFWHKKWTWKDHSGSRVLPLLVRFHLVAGASSLAPNLLLMPLLVEQAGMAPVAANLLCIVALSTFRFVGFHRFVFQPRMNANGRE